ncbi:MAG TPA: methionyl-tRNA formyltransferase [Vicinamibacterales bacterium]|nr:methionyl-tRNA formyltransferase [Vicinamibacterales bacterium]
MPLRIVFFGTPEFAVPTLAALIASSHAIAAVVTQPDRPRGRGQHLQPSPVKALALEHGLPVLQPPTLKDDAAAQAVRDLGVDLGVVAAYGRILPQRLLDIPRLGMINVHASLLPRWRGAAPVHRAVMAGDRTTGVTIMRVVLALDAGPKLAVRETEIGATETSGEVERRLAKIGGELLVEVVDRLAAGPVTETPQNDALATYAAKLDKHERSVDWSRSAQEIHDRIRGLQPWPVAASMLHDKRLLLRASAVDSSDLPHPRPGEIVGVESDGLVVGTGAGLLRLLEVQAEGRPPASVRDFLNGHRVVAGDRFLPLPVAAT